MNGEKTFFRAAGAVLLSLMLVAGTVFGQEGGGMSEEPSGPGQAAAEAGGAVGGAYEPEETEPDSPRSTTANGTETTAERGTSAGEETIGSGEPSIPESGDAQNAYPFHQPARKDPFIAGLLSWFMMGIGQIYCREYTKGSILIAADLADKVSLILLLSHINNRYSPEEGEAVINWGGFDTSTKVLIVSYLAASLGLRFYSTIDAIRSANRYNDRMFAQREKNGLAFDYDGKRLKFSYSFPMNE